MSEMNMDNLSSYNSGKDYLKRKCFNCGAAFPLCSKKSKNRTSSVAEENESVIHRKDQLTDVPNEILLNIMARVSFEDLLNLQKVNKKFRDVIEKRVFPNIHKLNKNVIPPLTEQKLITIYENKTELVNKPAKIIINSIKALFSRTVIHHADLSIFHTNFSHPDEQISSLFSMTPQLISLNATYIILYKSDLINIAKYCPLLEELCLNSSLKKDECGDGLTQIFIKCPNIKYLDLSDNRYLRINVVTIPNQLRYLNLYFCGVTLATLNLVAARAKHLETLFMDYLYLKIPDFNTWISNFAKLKFLDISHISNEIIWDFSNLKELEMLSLHFNDKKSFNVEALHTLRFCPKLKAVEIFFPYNFDINLFEIFKDCQALEYCYLRGFSNFTQLIDFVQHRQLKYLAIGNIKAINPEITRSLLIEYTSLTHLEIIEYPYEINKVIEQCLKEENPHRNNILKLALNMSPFPLPICKWLEVYQVRIYGGQFFKHFTNIKKQYHIEKSSQLNNGF